MYSSLERAKAEVKNAAEGISHEKNKKEELISEETTSQALLMIIKREERFNKSKLFNGFVLEQRSSDDNEFLDFLILLKQNAKNLPSETRIGLAVVTRFIGPRDDKKFYNARLLWQRHWSAVELYIDENNHVNSFVLDAANSIGYRGIHARLKANFPEGNHYVYKCDHFILDQKKNKRRIQTQNQGCSVFVTDHLKQLSQIDSTTLFKIELPSLVNKGEHTVKLQNFEGKQTKLIRIFRGMQSWSGLNSLGQELLTSPIKETKGKIITLYDYAKNQMSIDGVNLTISKKSEKYKAKKRNYFEALSSDVRLQIMLQRQGFTFIKNPILFEFCTGITLSKKEDLINFLTIFHHELEINNHHFLSVSIKKNIENIFNLKNTIKTKLDHEINFGKFKNEILLSIASIFKHLDDENRIKGKFILNAIFKNSLPLLQQRKIQVLGKANFDLNLYLNINQNDEPLVDNDGCILTGTQNKISPPSSLQDLKALNEEDINLVVHLGNLEAIKACLEKAPDVTQTGIDGWTPLMRAVNAGRFDIVKVLYDYYPELHQIDIEHRSKAAYLATKHGYLEILGFLLKNGVNPNSLATENNETKPLIIVAAEKKRFDLIELLFAYGANLKLSDGNGNTLFHVAVNTCDINLIKFLVEQNLNPNIRANNGCSPLYIAALQNPYEEKNALLQTLFSSKQMDIHACDENGLTQFWLAAKNGDLGVLLVLLELGVELPNTIDSNFLHRCISKTLLTDKQHAPKIGQGLLLLYKAGILKDCFAQAVIESSQDADSFAEGLVALHEKGILRDTIFEELKKHISHAFSICMALSDLHTYHMLNDKNQKVLFASSEEANDNVNHILRVLQRQNILNDENFQVSMSSSEPDFFKILIRLNWLDILNDKTRQALIDNSKYAKNILNILRITNDNIFKVNFLTLVSNAVKIDTSSQKLLKEQMLEDTNYQALLNDPDNADEIASNLIFRRNKVQRINILLNTYTQFQNLGFFSGSESIKEIGMLSDLKGEIAKISHNDLPEMIDSFKTQEKYRSVFEGKFKDQIQGLLNELIGNSPSP